MAATDAHSTAANRPVDWNAQLAKHGHWLRTVLFARSYEPAAVEELMQDVAAEVLRQEARPHDPQKIAPWLYRLAVRRALLYRRKLGRTRRLQQTYAALYSPAEQDNRELDPLQWLLADERRQLVRKALVQLHRKDAEILMLKYTENWNYKQLAEHLGITESAVEARLHRARRKLRRELNVLNVVEVLQ